MGRYLRKHPTCVIQYTWQALPGAVVVRTDSDWAGCRETRRSTSGLAVFLGEDLFYFSSRFQKSVALTSGETEFQTQVAGVAGGLSLPALFAEFCLHSGLHSLCDSSAARGIMNHSGTDKKRAEEPARDHEQKVVERRKSTEHTLYHTRFPFVQTQKKETLPKTSNESHHNVNNMWFFYFKLLCVVGFSCSNILNCRPAADPLCFCLRIFQAASENSLVRLIQSLTVQLDLWTLLLLERRIRPANSFRATANLVAAWRFLSPGHVEIDIASRTVVSQPQKNTIFHFLSHRFWNQIPARVSLDPLEFLFIVNVNRLNVHLQPTHHTVERRCLPVRLLI